MTREIHEHMTILDVVAAHRSTEHVFRERDMQAGECILCQALFLTLDEACAKYGLDLPALMADLEAEILREPQG
ncbi:hypothetical protein [Desulfocurvus sp. DL9XJH121]